MKTNYSLLLVLFISFNSFAFRTVIACLPVEPTEEIVEEVQDRSNDVNYQEYVKNLEDEEV